MALTLTKEDGTGKVDANAYASAADCDAYHDGHLYAAAWTGAPADRKAAALVMATRLIDAEYQFKGTKANDGQALQWPRYLCPDADSARLWGGTAYVSSDQVPKAVTDATCEMARELLIADRTAAPAGEGLKYLNDGATQTGYDKGDTRPVISHVTQAMLAKYGSLIRARSGMVPLVRT
jgi:hypothetical protein